MRKSLARRVVNSFTKNKSTRTSAEVSAESSASVADVSQSNHSAATSRNLREISIRLDDYLKQIDQTDGEVEVDLISMSRQVEKVRKYINGSLPSFVEQTSLSERDFNLIYLAAWTAKAVYAADLARMEDVAPLEEFSDYQLTEHSERIKASFRDGTVKATHVQLFSSETEKISSKLVVVAIRGSTSKRRDWTVNFDDIGDGTDGEGFLNADDRTFQVHGGFLDCAKGMVEKVSEAVSSVLSNIGEETKDIQLLFTGHSAGGAVASLLYAHMMSKNSSSLTDLFSRFTSIHCVVFGSPPVTKPALDTYGQSSTFFSIINEGDPVPRIDKDYIESLLTIYIAPMPVIPTEHELPPMLLDNAGTILFLKDGLEGFSAVPDDEGQKEIKKILRATIFGNPRAHKMDMYLWKLQLIRILI